MKLTIGEKQFDFEFRVNSLCELEREAKANVGEVLAMPKYQMYRYMMWAGLLKHHNVTLNQAGDLVEAYLDSRPEIDLVQLITEAITAAGFMQAQGREK